MAQLSYTVPYGTDWSGTVVINCQITYDPATNRSTVSFQQSSVNYPGRKGYGSYSDTTVTVSAGDNPSSSGSASLHTEGNTNPAGVSYYATPSPSVTVQHSAGPGAKTVTLGGSTQIAVYPFTYSDRMVTPGGSGSTTVTAYTVPDGSAIAGVTASVRTTDSFSLSMTRYSGAYWHKATIQVGSTTLYSSAAFETSLSFTVPRSWFNAYPNSASLAATLSVQTYTSAACTTAVGSPATCAVTVTADTGMAPVIGAGFAEAAAYNTDSAASSISGYVQGCSKAHLTLKRSKLTLANNAAAASYTVSCQGAESKVTSPGATATADTAVLTGTGEIPITVTVTDSRGLTASTVLSVTPMPYGLPTISAVSVIRCTSNGTESADGTYYRAKATAGCSSLNGQNSVTLKAQVAQGGGSYGSAVTLTSGTAKTVNAGLNPDLRATVKLTATDALGSTTETTVTLPGRKWALKFRADGLGAAFGKAPESSKALELPADWTLRIGTESFLQKVYPVGSIYLSVNSTSPATLFGGTWQRIQDRFLLAAGSTYAAGATGGEAAHTLTANEIAAHDHAVTSQGYNVTLVGNAPASGSVSAWFYGSGGNSRTGSAGGGQAHNNMPPYLAVYIWKRTA